MSVELKGVRIAGLKLTTGTVIPVIKCTVSYTNGGFDSHEEFAAFQEALYPIVKGATITCGVWWWYRITENKPDAIQDLASGAHVQGDDTGFKLSYDVMTGHNVVEEITNVTLSYKGNSVAVANVYTGYSNFETTFMVIYVTENGNIIRSTGMIGLETLYDFNSGIAVVDMVPVGYIADGGTIRTPSGYEHFFVTSPDNIKPYITKEWDPEDSDPYSPEGPAETGGGGGTFDITSDPNPIPSDPTISATDTGFMTVFVASLSEIQSLSNSLWADIFPATLTGGALHETAEALKNIVASPYDAILGCHIVPVSVSQGATKNVKLYGVLPSSVSLHVAASQWVTKDCGTLDIEPFAKSYLDYAPYTKVTSLYLPFIGVVSLDVDIIMNTQLGVVYKIDIVSGQCIAFITVDGDVKFQYQGQCAVPLPVTSIDWSNTVSAGLGIVGSVASIAGSAVGGALGGGGAGGALAGSVKGLMGEAGSIAQNVMNSKPDIKSGGGIGGSAALMGCKYPYLIMERPKKSTPKKGKYSQNHWTGYPSNIAARLGDLTGYTEVSRIFVNSTNATADEKTEIEKLLSEGVYI